MVRAREKDVILNTKIMLDFKRPNGSVLQIEYDPICDTLTIGDTVFAVEFFELFHEQAGKKFEILSNEKKWNEPRTFTYRILEQRYEENPR